MTHRRGTGILILISSAMCNCRGSPADQNLDSGAQEIVIAVPQELPKSRTGQELIGQPLKLDGLRWLNTPSFRPLILERKVTLLRWWTNTCPFCERSLPAIEHLRKQFGSRGFQTVAVYHPKPRQKVNDREILQASAALGYRGPVAADLDWTTLVENYLANHPGSPTSVSFLLGRQGNVRFVHAGPALYPADDTAAPTANRDYVEITAAIQVLLGE